jgi:hypothetical protein
VADRTLSLLRTGATGRVAGLRPVLPT